MASCSYWVSYSNLSDCNSGAGEDLMSCYVYLHTFLHNLSWCLVFLEMLRPWLKCQINSVGLHRAWLAQHAFHIKNAPHGVEEDGSWFSLSPCRVFFSEACDTTARPSVEFSENQKWWQSLCCCVSEPFMRNGRPPTSHSMHSFLHQYTGSFKKPPLRRPHSVIGGTLGSFMAMPRNGSRLGETYTLTHTHTHGRKWVVGEQMASRNKQETCHGPDTSILHSQTLEAASPSRPQPGCFCQTDSWMGY